MKENSWNVNCSCCGCLWEGSDLRLAGVCGLSITQTIILWNEGLAFVCTCLHRNTLIVHSVGVREKNQICKDFCIHSFIHSFIHIFTHSFTGETLVIQNWKKSYDLSLRVSYPECTIKYLYEKARGRNFIKSSDQAICQVLSLHVLRSKGKPESWMWILR